MAFPLRLFLLLLLAVALPDRAAQAAPWRAQGADWNARKGFPAPWLEESLDPVGPPSGPPAGKTQAKGEDKSLEPSELLDQMLRELERQREMKREPVQQETFPEGSSDSVPDSAAGREAMPGTVPGDWDQDMDYLEALALNNLKLLEDAEAVSVNESDLANHPMSRTEPLGSRSYPLGDDGASTTTRVPDSQKDIETGFCQGTLCWLEITAMVAGGELIIMLCCFGICYACKRKRHLLEEKLKAGGWSQDLYSQKSYSSSSDSDELIFAPSSLVML
ncbi:uncharacterized protein LOC111935252 isoform X2 [Cyanistes caeruleus]|uniref:uncharacterized protein LOC111935252 isoform X2 n=1 Tax=Cyanistes caeruleus TaxID=156563 RepID=UPI000CDAABBB|nr:uncharacterized protein LOC111935252 isoform X2 [Cyanistes caeruleus]